MSFQMNNIIGLHVQNNPDRAKLDPVLAKLNPALCVVLVLPNQAHYARGLAEAFPGIKWVVRLWWADLGTPNSFGDFEQAATSHQAGEVSFDPERAYRNWLNIDGGQIGGALNNLRGLDNVWIQGHNEVGISSNIVAFERQRTAQTMNEYGLKSVVINDGVGKSEYAHFALYHDKGLYTVLHDTGGALGRHDYAGGMLELWHGEAQAVGQDGEAKPLAKHPKEFINQLPVYEAARFNDLKADELGDQLLGSHLAFRILRDHHYLNETGGGNIPVFITEFGYDDAGRQSLTPYFSNTYTPNGIVRTRQIWDEWGIVNQEEVLGKQMAYADAQLRKVPAVVGAAWYQYGDSASDQWKLYDMQDVDFVPHYLAALKPEPAPAPPVAMFAVPEGIKAGQSFNLQSASSGEITGYRWEYGNGEAKVSKQITLWFAAAGTYPVTLTVTGPGGSDSITHNVVIVPADEPPPEPKPTPAIRVIARIQFGKLSIGAWIE